MVLLTSTEALSITHQSTTIPTTPLDTPSQKALQQLQTDVTHSPYLAARHPDPSPPETESHFLKRHTPYQPRDPTTSNMAESLLQTRLRIGARCSICDLVSGKQIERDSIAL